VVPKKVVNQARDESWLQLIALERSDWAGVLNAELRNKFEDEKYDEGDNWGDACCSGDTNRNANTSNECTIRSDDDAKPSATPNGLLPLLRAQQSSPFYKNLV